MITLCLILTALALGCSVFCYWCQRLAEEERDKAVRLAEDERDDANNRAERIHSEARRWKTKAHDWRERWHYANEDRYFWVQHFEEQRKDVSRLFKERNEAEVSAANWQELAVDSMAVVDRLQSEAQPGPPIPTKAEFSLGIHGDDARFYVQLKSAKGQELSSCYWLPSDRDVRSNIRSQKATVCQIIASELGNVRVLDALEVYGPKKRKQVTA